MTKRDTPDQLYIPILLGTTRAQRKSSFAADFVYQASKKYENIQSEIIDPNDFNFPGDGNDPEAKDPRYTEISVQADGFVIVTPEYNHSFPGSLKRMIDSELRNYIHKPVALAGVSNGQWGGVRAIEALLSPLRTMGLITTFTDMQFPKINELFDENGTLQDEKYFDYIDGMFRELIWMAEVMKYGRENVASQYHKKGDEQTPQL